MTVDWQQTAEHINRLARFCGVRDVSALTREELQRAIGSPQADVLVLFGGSILWGGDVLAAAMGERVAKKYIIVGGVGHTTQTLRDKVQGLYPQASTAGQPEARVFAAYLREKFGLAADYLECRSTNCGNNITHLLALLDQEHIPCQSIILCQDATMQRRMAAGWEKYAPDVRPISFATYAAEAIPVEGGLGFAREIPGMWDMERYISLLLGEIPRLADNETGYGPKGRGYISHVDISEEVSAAFESLARIFPDGVRTANDKYASAQ